MLVAIVVVSEIAGLAVAEEMPMRGVSSSGCSSDIAAKVSMCCDYAYGLQ